MTRRVAGSGTLAREATGVWGNGKEGTWGAGVGAQAADGVARTGASATNCPGLCMALSTCGRGWLPPPASALCGIPVPAATPEPHTPGRGETGLPHGLFPRMLGRPTRLTPGHPPPTPGRPSEPQVGAWPASEARFPHLNGGGISASSWAELGGSGEASGEQGHPWFTRGRQTRPQSAPA